MDERQLKYANMDDTKRKEKERKRKLPRIPPFWQTPIVASAPTPPAYSWLPVEGKAESAPVELGHKQDVPYLLCEGTASSEPAPLALSSCAVFSPFDSGAPPLWRQCLAHRRDLDLLLVHRVPLFLDPRLALGDPRTCHRR